MFSEGDLNHDNQISFKEFEEFIMNLYDKLHKN